MLCFSNKIIYFKIKNKYILTNFKLIIYSKRNEILINKFCKKNYCFKK